MTATYECFEVGDLVLVLQGYSQGKGREPHITDAYLSRVTLIKKSGYLTIEGKTKPLLIHHDEAETAWAGGFMKVFAPPHKCSEKGRRNWDKWTRNRSRKLICTEIKRLETLMAEGDKKHEALAAEGERLAAQFQDQIALKLFETLKAATP